MRGIMEITMIMYFNLIPAKTRHTVERNCVDAFLWNNVCDLRNFHISNAQAEEYKAIYHTCSTDKCNFSNDSNTTRASITLITSAITFLIAYCVANV